MIRLVLVGKKAVGKSFCADYLEDNWGIKKIGLDEPLQEFVRKVYYYAKYKKMPWEQKLRMYDALYKLDPNMWVTYLEGRLKTTTRDVVVHDPRYISEVQYLQTLGFVVVRVLTPEDSRKRRIGKSLLDAAAGSVILHEYFNSDPTQGYNVDFTIVNDTRENARKSLDIIMEKLKQV